MKGASGRVPAAPWVGAMSEGFVFGLVIACGLFWLAYRRPRPRRWLLPRPVAARPRVSAVDRQHRHLQAGGLIGETAFESAKTRLRELLAAGQATRAEGELRAGLEFAVRVRALAEIGTTEAGQLLERLLSRTLTRDPVEQAWYWVDVVGALRKLNRSDALPAVLRCAEIAADLQQGTALAAEAVAFPNFPGALHHLTTDEGRLAVRVLGRAARGAREGTADAVALIRAGLGDHLAAVCETAPTSPDPWLTSTVLEAERIGRRLDHWSRLFAPDVRPVAERQAARLAASHPTRIEWLSDAARRLIARFPFAPADEQAAALRCLNELQADVIPLFPLLPDRRAAWWPEAVRCLTWAKSSAAGPVLAGHALRHLGSWRGSGAAVALIGSLRGHQCLEAENVLVRAAGASNAAVRRAAMAAFGWTDPLDPYSVTVALQAGRGDPDAGVRHAAVGALARIGERAAVQEFLEGLNAEDAAIRQLTALTAAEEGLTWLWPDLDAMADSPDPDTALAACEALERMREQILGPLG